MLSYTLSIFILWENCGLNGNFYLASYNKALYNAYIKSKIIQREGSNLKSADRSDLKLQNRKTVYHFIRNSKEQTVYGAQISRTTGISLPTVIKTLDFFSECGLLKPVGVLDSEAAGRRPSLFKFIPNQYYSVGLAYDSKYLEFTLIDLNYNIIESRRKRIHSSFTQLMEKHLAEHLTDFLSNISINTQNLISIGFALPVILDTEHCCTRVPAPLIGIKDCYDFEPHRLALQERFQCPVFFESDVGAAAVAEYKMRKPPKPDDLVYITLGNGVGSGIILNGTLHRGNRYSAGEISGMVFNESMRKGEHLPQTLEDALTPSVLKDLFGYNVFEDTETLNPENNILVADYIARHLAFAISNLNVILDIQHFVLGGFVVEQLEHYIFRFIQEYLNPTRSVNISRASSNYTSSQGAGAQSIDKYLSNILMND